jgi:hypothetical protein
VLDDYVPIAWALTAVLEHDAVVLAERPASACSRRRILRPNLDRCKKATSSRK